MKARGLFTTVLLIMMTITAALADIKRYEVKSGIIEYSISGGGTMMGVNTQTTGSSKTVFKDWGATELQSGINETVTMGQKQRSQELSKLEGGNLFVVDFNQKIIYKYTPQMLADSDYKDLAQSSKEMMASMGGKKITEEDFLGYACEVWEIMQVKLWIHKGIILKTESNIMGIKHTMSATKIELNTSIAEEALKLPDYTIKEADMQRMMQEGEDDDDNDSIEPTQEQMEEMQEMMKNFDKV